MRLTLIKNKAHFAIMAGFLAATLASGPVGAMKQTGSSQSAPKTTKQSQNPANSSKNSCQTGKTSQKNTRSSGFWGGNALVSSSVTDTSNCDDVSDASKPSRTEPLQCRSNDKKCLERYQRFKKSQVGPQNWDDNADKNKDGRVDEDEWKLYRKDEKLKNRSVTP